MLSCESIKLFIPSILFIKLSLLINNSFRGIIYIKFYLFLKRYYLFKLINIIKEREILLPKFNPSESIIQEAKVSIFIFLAHAKILLSSNLLMWNLVKDTFCVTIVRILKRNITFEI